MLGNDLLEIVCAGEIGAAIPLLELSEITLKLTELDRRQNNTQFGCAALEDLERCFRSHATVLRLAGAW